MRSDDISHGNRGGGPLHNTATPDAAGFMSAADKAALDNIESLTALADPGADRILFWDFSAGNYAFLSLGTNLSITGTTLNATGGSGISDGDYGDITVSGGGTVLTIDNGAVTLAKQADMATASVVYRKTAGAGPPEVQSLATLKTDLGLTGTNSGDETASGILTKLLTVDGAGSGLDADLLDGQSSAAFAAASHNHAASDINSGTIATARLGSGTANSSSYLRGDQTWATIAGGGDVTGPASSVDNEIALFSSTTGKVIKRATTTGIIKATSGVIAAAVAGTDYMPPYVHVSLSAGATTTGANTTPVSVTGAVFTYAANSVYYIRVMGRLNSAAATTGAAIQFYLSSAVTAIDVNFFHQLAAGTSGTLTGGHSIANDTSAGASSGVPAGPLDVPITAFALLVTGANTGTCQLRLRSETTAVTELLAGTVMIVEKVL
jgi:hypothetical protein